MRFSPLTLFEYLKSISNIRNIQKRELKTLELSVLYEIISSTLIQNWPLFNSCGSSCWWTQKVYSFKVDSIWNGLWAIWNVYIIILSNYKNSNKIPQKACSFPWIFWIRIELCLFLKKHDGSYSQWSVHSSSMAFKIITLDTKRRSLWVVWH